MAVKHPIPVPVLRQLLRLDAETGKLYWLSRSLELCQPGRLGAAHTCAQLNTRFAGKEALTTVAKCGYRQGKIFGRLYLAHRVVFALHHGRWPIGEIDHRDGNPLNNLPVNLRDASRQENVRNARSHKDTSSQFRGVSWVTRDRKWIVRCHDRNGINRCIGHFAEETAAANAYDDFAREHHGEFAKLNFPG